MMNASILTDQALKDMQLLLAEIGALPLVSTKPSDIQRLARRARSLVENGWARVRVRAAWEELTECLTAASKLPAKAKATLRRAAPVGWIYLVECEGHFKVGFTNGEVEDRVYGMQTGSHADIREVAMFHGTRGDERMIHELSAGYRVRGEWFSHEATLIYALAGWLPSWCETRGYIDGRDAGEYLEQGFEDFALLFPNLTRDDLRDTFREMLKLFARPGST